MGSILILAKSRSTLAVAGPPQMLRMIRIAIGFTLSFAARLSCRYPSEGGLGGLARGAWRRANAESRRCDDTGVRSRPIPSLFSNN